MSAKTVGYVRVSAIKQKINRQIETIVLVDSGDNQEELLKQHAVEKLFIDRASGKDRNRPALKELIGHVRKGDKIIVYSIDRLARNLQELLHLVEDFTSQGVSIFFIKESLTFDGKESIGNKLILQLLGAMAEFERSIILERQKEGIAIAKRKGSFKGRPFDITPATLDKIKTKRLNGEPVKNILREFDISRASLYRYEKGVSIKNVNKKIVN